MKSSVEPCAVLMVYPHSNFGKLLIILNDIFPFGNIVIFVELYFVVLALLSILPIHSKSDWKKPHIFTNTVKKLLVPSFHS